MKDLDKGLIVIITILSLPLLAVWRGYVLSIVWSWFIIPFGFDELGVAHAIGLSMAISMFTYAGSDSKDQDALTSLFSRILDPLLALIFGAIIHSFM